MWYRLMHLFIMMVKGRSNKYLRSMLMHMLVMQYQQRNDLPQSEMLRKGLHLFNEESGERSFSCLGRASLNDSGMKKNLEKMSSLYAKINRLMQCDDAFRKDRENPDKKKEESWRKTYTPESDEVVAVQHFLEMRIRQIANSKEKRNVYKVYDGEKESYKNADHAGRNMVPFYKDVSSYQEWPQVKEWFEFQVSKLGQSYLGTDAGWQVQGQWPEFDFSQSDTDAHPLNVAERASVDVAGMEKTGPDRAGPFETTQRQGPFGE